MENPFLKTKTWVYFVLAHVWWLGILLTLSFCSGALGVGYQCIVPGLESVAGLIELSTIFVIPVILPVFFYIYLANQWRTYRGKERMSAGKMLIILFGVVTLLVFGVYIWG